MDREFQEIEDALKTLRPASADAACLERLAAAMEGRLQSVEPALQGIERELAGLRPAVLAPDLAGRLLETVTRVPFPVNEKVVLFPGHTQSASRKAARRPWWTAAAAVAMAGAFSALMLDGGKQAPGTVSSSAEPSAALPAATPAGFVPAGVHTGLHDARDQGVIWNAKGEAMRVLSVEYRDRVKFRAADGTIVEQEVPRVEYLLMPEKVD